MIVFQGASYDLGRRSRAGVDQHDNRLAVGEIAGLGEKVPVRRSFASADRYDLARVKKSVGDRDALIGQSARIVTQIEDEALQPLRCDLPGDLDIDSLILPGVTRVSD